MMTHFVAVSCLDPLQRCHSMLFRPLEHLLTTAGQLIQHELSLTAVHRPELCESAPHWPDEHVHVQLIGNQGSCTSQPGVEYDLVGPDTQAKRHLGVFC